MLKAIGLILLLMVVCLMATVRLRPLAAGNYDINLGELEGGDDFDAGVSGHFVSVQPAENADAIAQKIENVVAATPRTTRLLGALTGGDGQQMSRATYVTRSALWGFPDVTTLEVEATNTGTTLRIYGRLVYGRKDFGVNKARIEGWLDQL